jgi:serine/alanine adding enzyme
MTDEIKIGLCQSEQQDAWDRYVMEKPDATVSHLACWQRIVSRSYGHPAFYFLATRGKKTAGILPLIWVKSRLFGNVLSSMPYQDYGGILADDDGTACGLLDCALDLKTKHQCSSLELRHRRLSGHGSEGLRKDKVTLILDMSTGAEGIWKLFSSKVRNQIRKAQKSGLNTQIGGSEFLPEFYNVFAVNMRDLGSPVHHPLFFSSIFAEFGEKARLIVVRDNNRIIGGLICLMFKDTAIVPWASCLRSYFAKCPNNLLYWDTIQYVCDQGCRAFDFGRSTIDSGTYHFKLQWGAKPEQLNWQYYFNQDQAKAGENLIPGNDVKFKMAAALWKRMPLPMTMSLGPRFRKFLTN